MATGAQIENQVQVNYEAIHKIGEKLGKRPPLAVQLQLEKELRRLWQAQQYWAAEYKRVTGQSMVLFQEIKITGDPHELSREAAALKAKEAARRRLVDGIAEVERENLRIQKMLQDQYDISTTMGNALFSHWTRMGAGLHAKHPLFVKKEIAEKVPPLLAEARKALAAGKYEKAWSKVSSAAAKVKWGFDFLNWWMDQLEAGAKRAEAGIKVSAALATLVVAAPLELGVLGTMAVAASGEGAMQGTNLALKGADRGDTVSLEDVKKAVLETVIAAGSAGLGKGAGKMVAKGLAGRVAKEILKGNPTEKQIEFVAERLELYLAANSAAIAKKMLKLDTDPDWNWWYMMVAPAINPIAVEMAKEPDLNKLVK
ncbi:MAG: hypothetical protein NW208_12615 [Bryobacter sp.]|nr:hypothetical protein [Bryobacter sp.]